MLRIEHFSEFEIVQNWNVLSGGRERWLMRFNKYVGAYIERPGSLAKYLEFVCRKRIVTEDSEQKSSMN